MKVEVVVLGSPSPIVFIFSVDAVLVRRGHSSLRQNQTVPVNKKQSVFVFSCLFATEYTEQLILIFIAADLRLCRDVYSCVCNSLCEGYALFC